MAKKIHGIIECLYDELVAVSELKQHPKNPNRHGPEQLAQYELIMRKNRVREAVRVSNLSGLMTKGHGQVLAAIRAGWTHVPVQFQDYENEDMELADMIADNSLARQSEIDYGVINEAVPDFDPSFDIQLLGIADFEIEPADKNRPDEDAVPEPRPRGPTRSKLGQIWKLGDHRLMCGSSIDPSDVSRLMGKDEAVLMNTDPPYGIAYVANAKSKKQSKNFVDIENDELDGEKLQEFLEASIKAAVPHLRKNSAFYLWHPMLTQGTFFAAAAAADILISRQIIWVKPSLVFGRGDYHWRHELCFYGWQRGNKPKFYGPRNQTTIWEMGRENDKIHPTQKPVALFETPILNHTKKGEWIYEPFSGSGSQIIAAEKHGRKCAAMEISPEYVDVGLSRWESFTGKQAKLLK